MKTQNTIRAAGLLLLSCLFQLSFANIIGGNLMGRVTDPETKEPIDGATVILENQGSQKVYYTNESGYYYASNVPAGVYNITITYMSNKTTVPAYKIGNDDERALDIQLGMAVNMKDVIVVIDRDAIIDPLNPQSDILRHKDLKDTPIKVVSDIAEMKAGVVKQNGEYHVHGARAGGLAYYIDGCRVMGSPDIPLCGLDSYRMYSGYIPAKYGDSNGAVVVIETRNFFSEH